MHVLVATHDFYPDPGSGGTGRYVAETASRLVERGHDVSVITRRRGDVPERETRGGVDVHRYDLSIAERSAPEILAQLPGAASAVADHVSAARDAAGDPDVVSLQGPVTSALTLRAVDADAPRVVTFHSPWPTEYRLKSRGEEGTDGARRELNVGVRRFVEGRVLSGADRLVALSDFMRGKADRIYDHSLPTSVVPGGVDVERFTPDGPTLDGIEGDPAFLTVRRLSERMGHELLLEAFATVVGSHPEARLYVAGDGPLREHLERTAERLGVADETAFLGYVPDEDLPAAYRSADVFVLPTTDLEGFGLATLEALASGLPVVATPVGGTVEVLDSLDSDSDPSLPAPALVDAAEPDAVAEGMSAWADLSARRRAEAERTCRRYAEAEYPWERTVAELELLYRQLR